MDVKLTLRIPEDLHAKLVALADADQRSLNGEIAWLLARSTEQREAKQ